MALSNIGNEPRREITESVVGIAAVTAYIAADYLTVTRVFGVTEVHSIILAFITFFLATIVAVFLLFLTHELGDAICNALGRADPRPRQRYMGRAP